MNLLELLNEDMKNAMRSKDSFTLGVIRMAKGAVQLEAINQRKELSDDEIGIVISKQIKLRKDAIEEFKKANRLDLVEQNEKEIIILNKYMPKQLTEEEIVALVNEVFIKVRPQSTSDIGLVMKEISPLVRGKADMSMVNSIIKEKLNEL